MQSLRIVEVSQSWGPDGSSDVQVTAACYRRLLGSRHVISPLTYTNTSQGTIIWNLINHTQSQTGGTLGITLGTSGPATLRTRSYEPGQNILTLITQLTEIAGGPTWEIDADLQLIVSDASAYPVKDVPLELGVTAVAMQRPSGAAAFANAGLALGNVESSAMQVATTAGIGTDPRGRWERVVSQPSVTNNTALLQMAQGIVDEAISPAVAWSITMTREAFFDEDITPGDYVTIVQPTDVVAPIGPPGDPVPAQIIGTRVVATADGSWVPSVTAVSVPGFPS